MPLITIHEHYYLYWFLTSLSFLPKKWDWTYLVTPSPTTASKIPKYQSSVWSICSLCITTESNSESSEPPLITWCSTTWWPCDIGIIHEGLFALHLFLLLPKKKRFTRNACSSQWKDYHSFIWTSIYQNNKTQLLLVLFLQSRLELHLTNLQYKRFIKYI